MPQPTVAIIGASAVRGKYGNKSVRAHRQAGYAVFPIHPKADEIEGLAVFHRLEDLPAGQLDRISVYVPPEIGIGLLESIRGAGAKEVWFNPGSESPELLRRAEELGLKVITGCSIVDLGLTPDQFPD